MDKQDQTKTFAFDATMAKEQTEKFAKFCKAMEELGRAYAEFAGKTSENAMQSVMALSYAVNPQQFQEIYAKRMQVCMDAFVEEQKKFVELQKKIFAEIGWPAAPCCAMGRKV